MFPGADEFKVDLMNIAKTTLSSKILYSSREHFAKIAVEAILRLNGSGNLEAIHMIKKQGGSLTESFLDDGYILDKKIGIGQPNRMEDAKILVANTAMDTDKIKIYGARVRVDSIAKVGEIEKAEKEKMRQKCERIIQHGINCFINRQLIYNFPEEIFADAGVLAIEHADFDGTSMSSASVVQLKLGCLRNRATGVSDWGRDSVYFRRSAEFEARSLRSD